MRDDAGAGVAGAIVQLTATGKSTRNTTSGSDGSYAFTGVEAGIWQIIVVPPTGFSGGSNPVVTVSANQEVLASAVVLTRLPVGTAPASAEVIMYQNAFVPGTVTIRAGGTVTWRNTDAVAHTATGTGFDTGTLAGNASSAKTFANAGTFDYVCSLHAGMSGKVVVQ